MPLLRRLQSIPPLQQPVTIPCPPSMDSPHYLDFLFGFLSYPHLFPSCFVFRFVFWPSAKLWDPAKPAISLSLVHEWYHVSCIKIHTLQIECTVSTWENTSQVTIIMNGQPKDTCNWNSGSIISLLFFRLAVLYWCM